MLERRGGGQAGGLLQLTHQLPAVEGIHKIDVTRTAIQHGDRQFAAIRHIKAGRLLIGIAAIFQFQFFHRD